MRRLWEWFKVLREAGEADAKRRITEKREQIAELEREGLGQSMVAASARLNHAFAELWLAIWSKKK